jgi:polyribonucleotide nucleotidyltransferase
MFMEKTYSTEWLGRTLTIKTGKLALQAASSVTVQYGETVVLATVVEAKQERAGIDFFPLMVDFEERLYAAGIIKGSRWIKREGRPSEEAILTGRMIDRSIRPLFVDDSRKDVQVILTVLSWDQENDYDIMCLVAASAVLSTAGLNWNGPIAGVRVGRKEGKLVFNPTYAERLESDLDLIVAGTPERVIMIEAGAKEIKEEEMLEAILAGQKEIAPALELLKKFKTEAAKEPKPVRAKLLSEGDIAEEKELASAKVLAAAWLKDNAKKILFDKVFNTKGQRKAAVDELNNQLDSYLFGKDIPKDRRTKVISKLAKEAVEEEVTKAILEEDRRVDGRALTELREILSEVSLLPRTHGTGLFSRGETQVLSIVTLGAPGLEQSLEGVEGAGTKRYMHHYNFPPYSVGETKNIGSPSRRDIGHGALAEKALLPVLPAREDFPYTIRVVSETMGSNGSSSMASVCGSTLALMDAGVPIKKAVAGIAIGIASNDEMSKWKVLTDLQDLEDGKGGMDFKIAGTADGITAIQLDTKTIGLDKKIIAQALTQGKEARLEILGTMAKAITAPRADLSQYAPRITSFHINPDRIREVIGPGGKVINEIIAATGVSIDIEDDGLVMICGTDAAKAQQAIDWVKSIVREFVAGEIFTGKVVKLLDFGAFVELTPGNDGMVHVSQLAPYRIGSPADFLKEGDVVTVKVKEIDEKGRVNLTMLGLPENEPLWKNEKGKDTGGGFGGGRPSGGFSRGGGGYDRRGGPDRRSR